MKLKELKNREKGIVKAKDILAVKNRELDAIRRKNLPKRGEFNKDLWDNNEGNNYIEFSFIYIVGFVQKVTNTKTGKETKIACSLLPSVAIKNIFSRESVQNSKSGG